MVRSTMLKEPRRRKPPLRAAKARGRAAGHGSDGRLTKVDWIEAGQDLVRDLGITNLRLAALTERLGVSTGSFYHHFEDFEEYLTAVAEYYSVDRVMGLLNRASAGAKTPIDRIKNIRRLSIKDRTFELDGAMRVWATMDQRAARAIIRAEEITLDFLAAAFRDLGSSAADAALKARILLSLNIARLATVSGKTRRAYFADALELLAKPGKPAK